MFVGIGFRRGMAVFTPSYRTETAFVACLYSTLHQGAMSLSQALMCYLDAEYKQ